MTLLGVIGCSLSMGGVLLVIRHKPPPPQQVELTEWGQACQLGLESENSIHALAIGETTYRGSLPGSDKFSADYDIYTVGAIELADLVLAAGQPQAGCLDYGLLRGEPVIWLRLVLADGQMKAYAALSSNSQRLAPDAPIHRLYCYGSQTNHPVDPMGPWRGFAALDVYPDCWHSGTATPP